MGVIVLRHENRWIEFDIIDRLSFADYLKRLRSNVWYVHPLYTLNSSFRGLILTLSDGQKASAVVTFERRDRYFDTYTLVCTLIQTVTTQSICWEFTAEFNRTFHRQIQSPSGNSTDSLTSSYIENKFPKWPSWLTKKDSDNRSLVKNRNSQERFPEK